MHVQEVKCFGVRAGEGNRALVVQGGPRDEAERQALARAGDVSACVFIDGNVLDYYYPHMRSPLCLHATLAAAHMLFTQQASGAPITVKTALRGQTLKLTREGGDIFVALQRQPVDAPAPPMELVAELLAAPGLSFAAPAAGVITVGHVQAVTDLLAAMQMEKMMRTITGSSRYASEAQRSAAYAKLDKVPPAQIYARLAYPLARTISAETASEMARFYSSSYGKKVVYRMYNSKASYAEPAGPAATAAERKDMQRPAFIKASKALAEADGVIRHEGFVLLQSIAK